MIPIKTLLCTGCQISSKKILLIGALLEVQECLGPHSNPITSVSFVFWCWDFLFLVLLDKRNGVLFTFPAVLLAGVCLLYPTVAVFLYGVYPTSLSTECWLL